MAIKRLPQDSILAIYQAGEIDAEALRDLLTNDPDRLKTIEEFRGKVMKILESFDKRWVVLCAGDTAELTDWASRMRLVFKKLDDIDLQLKIKKSPLFSIKVVASAMGFVNAFRVAIKLTLDYNELTLVEEAQK